MSLGNTRGAVDPQGLAPEHVVEVVLSHCQYQASGLTSVPEGGVCSGDCQCQGPKCVCREGRCVPPNAGPGYVPPRVHGEGDSPPPEGYCGCSACSQAVWDEPAPTIYQTCGERIAWLSQGSLASSSSSSSSSSSFQDADDCERIAQDYPCECGACRPVTCGSGLEETQCTPTSSPTTSMPTQAPLTRDQCCFPNAAQRTDYTLWGGTTIQVKQGRVDEICVLASPAH
jgi:hypothetical protein